MKVGLFIPRCIDAFFPEVGVATLELLERLGCSVEYPLEQTCCGQPMADSGCQDDSAATEALFVRCFKDFNTVVGPSGGCVHHVRFQLDAIEQTSEARKVRASIRELAHPAAFHAAESAGQWALEYLPRFLLYNPLNPWGKHRELPAVPRQTFRQWYLENRREKT
jgi:hypothetical protein